ncbi:MAG TPA: alginate lyase family protein [Dermatophilaceae bacterium]|nr:alginate lyase family protein [Dermatophilaceae bacterium]
MTTSFRSRLLTDDSVALPDPPLPTPELLADAERVLNGRWLLVGQEYHLGPDPDWRVNPSSDKEWQIAQHKHYFGRNLLHGLLATGDPAYLRCWSGLLRSWLATMGTGFIAVSDAQVEALRLRSWVESLLLLRQAHARGLLDPAGGVDPVDDDLLRVWLDRMGVEARYVSTHLKPVRNHRTFQLHSVFLVGVCVPQAPGAQDLVADAVRLLTDNLLRELLPDGVHVEMATHYHQLVAEAALDVAALAARNGIALDPLLLERIHAATVWSAWLQWPDGHIPLLGDSDDGDHRQLLLRAGDLYADPSLTWAGSLGSGGRPPAATSRDFPDAGYLVLTDGWGQGPPAFARRTHVLVDAARLGEGAHSHYDALSLVLHCDGVPALVDPGRYTYSGEPVDGVDWRHTFKSTRAHNTVTVDGRDQTRYLSRNKHGPDAEVVGRVVHVGREGDWVAAAVRSREYTPTHARVVVFVRRQYLLVLDRVRPPDAERGLVEHTAELAWHLPASCVPDLRPLAGGAGSVTTAVRRAPAQLLVNAPGRAGVRVDSGWVSTRYGVKVAAPVVRARLRGTADLILVTVIAPRTTGVVLDAVTALADGCPCWRVQLRVDGVPFADRVWFPPEAGRVSTPEGVRADVGGRFLLVRTDAGERAVWATGERVAGLSAGGRDVPLDQSGHPG